MIKQFILGFAVLAFVAPAAYAAESHCAEMGKEAQEAVDHGKAGHAKALVEHAEGMLEHAKGCDKEKPGNVHVKEAMKHEEEAVDHGKAGHLDVAMKHAESALEHAKGAEK
ncbi:MAG: hypothetical protein HYR81_01675 [Nitrospirae bacterium]|nr:hypothetical protein [Nitrospirota bacterium]